MKPLAPDADGGSTAAYPGYRAEQVHDEAEHRDLRVVLRADAGRTQGTGHVMRLLTLAEALRERGHHAILASAEIDVPWLFDAVSASGVEVVAAPRDEIDVDGLLALRPDWVVVDSYLVPAASIDALDPRVPVLLLADGDARGADATLYLDQNLGAAPLAGVGEERQLRGAHFALVRAAIRNEVRTDAASVRHDPPHVLVVLGGTDPDDRTVDVARACAALAGHAAFTFVAPSRQHAALDGLGPGRTSWQIHAPTPQLPGLLGDADVIVSAGGTSAWDVGTLGTPSVLLALVANQQASLAAAVDAGVALGFDVVDAPRDLPMVAEAVEVLLTDAALRSRVVASCRATFDGMGGRRVVEAVERHPRTRVAGGRP